MDILEYELCRCQQHELTAQAHDALAASARRRARRAARRLARGARVLVLPVRPATSARPASAERETAA